MNIRKMVPLKARKRIKQIAARLRQIFLVKKSYGLNGLDLKVMNYLPKHPGIFVEVGANDGISQSNTWVLEAYYGWKGLLIEPIDWLAEMCASFRRSETVHAALTDFSKDGCFLSYIDKDLVTKIGIDDSPEDGHRVVSRALSNLLDEKGIVKVDFFSLDVEGGEMDVLRGIDFERHFFGAILVETKKLDQVQEFLQAWFLPPVSLSHHDYVFVNAQREDVRGNSSGGAM